MIFLYFFFLFLPFQTGNSGRQSANDTQHRRYLSVYGGKQTLWRGALYYYFYSFFFPLPPSFSYSCIHFLLFHFSLGVTFDVF